MRISCHWLSRHVDLDGIDLDALGRRFTMAVSELGLSEAHAGILVLDAGEPGQLLRDVAPVEDTVFVIDNKSLTHRPDCWGHRGIAREVAALIERPLKGLDNECAFTNDVP